MIDEIHFSDDEYEKQFFGFSSTEFCYDFKYFVKKTIQVALSEVESVIRTEIEDVYYDKESLKSRIAMLEKIYIDTANVHIENFQKKTREIFKVAPNFPLVSIQSSCNDITKLKEEVAELQSEILREEVFIQKLNQYKEVIDTMLKSTSSQLKNLVLFAKKFELKNDNVSKEKQNVLKNDYLQMLQHYFGCGEVSNIKFQDISNFHRNVALVPGQEFFECIE